MAEYEKYSDKNVIFVVLPDKYFLWFDARPGEFGLVISLLNFETGFGFKRYPGLSQQEKIYEDLLSNPDFRHVKGRYSEFLSPQFYLLLETRWLQPKPVRVISDRVEGKKVNRVDVIIEGYGRPQRYAVYADEKTNLPVRIAWCPKLDKDEIHPDIRLENHRGVQEIAGIKIPAEKSGAGTLWGKACVDLNVEYEPQFFDRLPDRNLNGLQWRKKGVKTSEPVATAVSPMSLKPEQIAELLKDLQSADADVQQAAMRDLHGAGQQAIPALTKILQNNDAELSYRAAIILLRIDTQHEDATIALKSLVKDIRLSHAVRQDAAFGLLRNDKGISLLTDLLTDVNIQVRRYALFAFDTLTERPELPAQIERAIPILKKLQGDEDATVRGMAQEVVRQIRNHRKQ